MRKCIWLTGLPGVGKTTLAETIKFHRPEVQVLDADVMRQGFWPTLGNVPIDRYKNCIRLSAIAGMLMEHGAEVIVAAVSPDLEARTAVREQLKKVGDFYSILLKCDEPRKKLWPNTTYEEGDHDAVVDTGHHLAPECAEYVIERYLERPQRALFVGRWQPFHAGHQVIIREALAKGPVAIGVRQSEQNSDNPHSVQKRIRQIRSTFEGQDVVVFAVPDIHSIHVGRDVGYKVHRDVEGISGTEERRRAREDLDAGGEG